MGILSVFKSKQKSINPGSGRVIHQTPINITVHKQNLTTAIMLKNYGNASPILPKYPQYFSTSDYNVGNPKWVHQDLVRKGLLVPSAPEEILNSLTVAELKDLLSAHSLSSTGRKADLIQRIIDSVNIDELAVFKKEKCYSLSDTGRQFLADNYDYVLFHKHRTWQLSFEGYCSLRNKIGGNKFYEIAERMLNQEISKSPNDAHIRYSYFTLSAVYKELNIPKKALLCLLFTQYMDLNGSYNYPAGSYLQGLISKKELLQNIKNAHFFLESVVDRIADLQEYFSEDMIKEIYLNQPVAARYCNEAEFRKVIHDIFDKKDFPQKKWASYFVKNFLAYHKL